MGEITIAYRIFGEESSMKNNQFENEDIAAQ
jgi:hypothetical protein